MDYDNKPCEYYIGEPKNQKHRTFPLSEDLKDLFSRIKTAQITHGITSEYVFANETGRINSHTITCAMSRRCKEAGIAEKRIHAIRKPFHHI